jgi:hypothetical protein
MFVKRKGRCRVELDCSDVRQLLNAKWVNARHETLEQTSCIFSFIFIDAQQYSRICFIQTLWQVGQGTENVSRKAATEDVNLADDPLEPMRRCECLVQGSIPIISAYMPSAFWESISMTRFWSSFLHTRILLSERTTDLMYAIISPLCPLSS